MLLETDVGQHNTEAVDQEAASNHLVRSAIQSDKTHPAVHVASLEKLPSGPVISGLKDMESREAVEVDNSSLVEDEEAAFREVQVAGTRSRRYARTARGVGTTAAASERPPPGRKLPAAPRKPKKKVD
jgi:hypothetical protein